MKKKTVAMAMLLSLLPSLSFAGHDHPEKYYQEQWCLDKGRLEYVLPDKTRCDCLTADHAVEVEYAGKWYEAIGQSLYYSLQTGKRSGIVLIIEKSDERKYWIRMNSTIEHFRLPIDTWSVGAGR